MESPDLMLRVVVDGGECVFHPLIFCHFAPPRILLYPNLLKRCLYFLSKELLILRINVDCLCLLLGEGIV